MDIEEYKQLVRELQPRLYVVAKRFFPDREDARDVVQEALCRLWLLCPKLPNKEEAQLIAYRITKNLCVSEWRKRSHMTMVEAGQGETPHEVTPQALMEEADNNRWLNARIGDMPASQRRIVSFKIKQGWSVDEISSFTGINKKSVTAILSAGRRELLDALRNRQNKNRKRK